MNAEGASVTQICAGAEAENAAVAGQRCRLIWRGCTEYCEQRRWREWQEMGRTGELEREEASSPQSRETLLGIGESAEACMISLITVAEQPMANLALPLPCTALRCNGQQRGRPMQTSPFPLLLFPHAGSCGL